MERKNKNTEKRESSLRIRTFVVYLCIGLASAGIIYRIADLQFFRDDLKRQPTKMEVVPVERGIIYSRNGDVLVQRVPKYVIAMDTYAQEPPQKAGDTAKILVSDAVFNLHVRALADSLALLFGKTADNWEKRLRDAREAKKRYFVICKDADISDYSRVRTFPIFCEKQYNSLAVKKADANGPKYPYGELACRTLGKVPPDAIKDTLTNITDSVKSGFVGIEGRFDKELSGTPGLVLKKYVSKVPIEMKSDDNVDPREGYNVRTTLDMTVQDVADKALRRTLQYYEAMEGCVIVMEVATGDILALANLKMNEQGNYADIDDIALAKYEPGSTFKTASMLVALNDEKVTPNTRIPLDYIGGGKSAKVGSRQVTDDHRLRDINPELWYVLAQSSNIGTARMIYDRYASDPQQYIDGLYKLGFGTTLSFPVVNGNKAPFVKSVSDKSWSKTTLSTMPWGYELHVTPLHLLTFYNAIANNGCMVKPRLVTEIFSSDSIIQKYEVDTLITQICSQQALLDIRSMLDSVVTCGTARNGFRGVPYTVAGKTGTAVDYSSKGKRMYNLSFCGYFPADEPKYSCIVLVKRPTIKETVSGGKVAIPVFREIATILYAKDYDLMPEAMGMSSDADLTAIPLSAKVRSTALETIFKGINFNVAVPQTSEWVNFQNGLCAEDAVSLEKNIVPDVKNMSLTDAVYILEKAGIAAEVIGYGRVKKQTPEANAPLPKNKKVILELDINS